VAVAVVLLAILAPTLALAKDSPAPFLDAPPAVSYRLPFAAGFESKVGQGWNTPYSHQGRSGYAYDFLMPIGTPVLAAADGRVSHVQTGHRACGGPGLLNDTNLVTIDHADGTATVYIHLSRVDVAVGDLVAAGQPIGLSGRVGYTGCVAHLHFARQAQGAAVTQSRPVFFQEYPGRVFTAGDVVEARPLTCLQSQPGMPSNAFCGQYFYGTDTRMASMAEAVAGVDAQWAGGRPAGLDIQTQRTGTADLTARWVGSFLFAATGSVNFAINASDGVRLIVDGNVFLDTWAGPAPAAEIVVVRTLTAGFHTIQLEFHHEGAAPATVSLGWWASDEGLGLNVQ